MDIDFDLVVNDEQIDEIFGRLQTWAKCAVGRQGITPMMAFRMRRVDGSYDLVNLVMSTPFDTVIEKKLAMRTAAQMAASVDSVPIAVGMITEAWLAHVPVGESQRFILPSDSDDRVEIAVCSVVTFDETQMSMATAKIQRDDRDRIVSIGEWDRHDEGVEANLLRTFYRLYCRMLREKLENADAAIHEVR